jgi:triphosphatase
MLNQTKPRPAKPRAPATISADITTDAAMVTLLSGIQADLVAALRAALDRPDAEAVHRLRIALRRLRTGLDICRFWSRSDAFDAVAAEARSLADALGAARNWDVLVTETLPRHVSILEGVVDLAPLNVAAGAERHAQYKAMLKRLDGPQPQRLLLGLALLVSRQPWRGPDGSVSGRLCKGVARSAAKSLTRTRRRQMRRGRKLDRLSDRERHRLRIATKLHSYAIDMLAPIWPKPARQQRYARDVAQLQAKLGRLNDLETTRGLLGDLAAADADPALHRAIGAVLGAVAQEKRERLSKLPRYWRAFRRARPFW